MERSDRLRAASSDCGASCAAVLFRLRGKTCGVFAFGRYMAAALFRLRRATGAAPPLPIAGQDWCGAALPIAAQDWWYSGAFGC